MTEGQATPQLAPAVAPLKSQKVTEVISNFRPAKVGLGE